MNYTKTGSKSKFPSKKRTTPRPIVHTQRVSNWTKPDEAKLQRELKKLPSPYLLDDKGIREVKKRLLATQSFNVKEYLRLLAPNKDWLRPFKPAGAIQYRVKGKSHVFTATAMAFEYKKPYTDGRGKFDFTHFVVTIVPAANYIHANPVPRPINQDELIAEMKRDQYQLQMLADDGNCSRCHTLAEPTLTKRRGGSELVWVTKHCPECGNSETEPID